MRKKFFLAKLSISHGKVDTAIRHKGNAGNFTGSE